MGYRKIYQSLHYKDLDTYVVVNGQKVLIQFRGGSLQPKVNGKFTTTDQDLVKAMDSDSGLNTSFKCIYSEKIAEEKPRYTAEDEATLDAPEEKPEETKNEFTKVPGIKTIQAARTYIVENFGIPASKMLNGVAVKEYAAEKKIVFVDLP